MSTGADNKSMPITPEYADGHERTFGKPKAAKGGAWVWRCSKCSDVTHEPDTLLSPCPRCGERTYGSVDAHTAPPVESERALDAPIMVDRFYEGVKSPIDGTDIGSRAKRREHMKEHDLRDSDDYRDTWAKDQAERDRFNRGERSAEEHRETRDLIGRLEYEQEKKNAKRR